MYQLIWEPAQLAFVLALLQVTVGFVSYFFISESKAAHQYITKRYGSEKAISYKIFFQRYTGVFCLGVFPLLLQWLVIPSSTWESFGFAFKNMLTSLYWTLGLGGVILLMAFLNAKKEDNLAMYPQIRQEVWTHRLLFFNAFSWAAYLFAYEILFRGLLLFGTASLVGAIPAIAINASIYSIAHIPKGIKETIGAIPLGIVLSILTFQTETIWIAFGVHVIMALSNDSFSLYYQPNMYLKKA
ncbi:MAG: CPBP family intramembrane metalloprotease [Cytophagales bacterium]|nr:MAG: CPBP family intramembrane metalloprotease [Cytophagales bacterium]